MNFFSFCFCLIYFFFLYSFTVWKSNCLHSNWWSEYISKKEPNKTKRARFLFWFIYLFLFFSFSFSSIFFHFFFIFFHPFALSLFLSFFFFLCFIFFSTLPFHFRPFFFSSFQSYSFYPTTQSGGGGQPEMDSFQDFMSQVEELDNLEEFQMDLNAMEGVVPPTNSNNFKCWDGAFHAAGDVEWKPIPKSLIRAESTSSCYGTCAPIVVQSKQEIRCHLPLFKKKII